MENLIETELFREAKVRLTSFGAQILDADNVAIFATADLDSIVSLAFLESAMIDAKIAYSRKILNSVHDQPKGCLLYTSPSPRDLSTSRMPSSA